MIWIWDLHLIFNWQLLWLIMTIPDSGFMMENGGSCLPHPPEEENRIVRDLMNISENNLKEGNIYYVISNRYFLVVGPFSIHTLTFTRTYIPSWDFLKKWSFAWCLYEETMVCFSGHIIIMGNNCHCDICSFSPSFACEFGCAFGVDENFMKQYNRRKSIYHIFFLTRSTSLMWSLSRQLCWKIIGLFIFYKL